jgi:hypothetical protein
VKTHAELVACVKRELSMRLAVYPRRVASGTMTEEKAAHEVECMRGVLAILETNNPQPSLFNDTDKQKPEKT